MLRMNGFFRLLAAAMVASAPCIASAEPWPVKPIRIVVTFPPGGKVTTMRIGLTGQGSAEAMHGADATMAAASRRKNPFMRSIARPKSAPCQWGAILLDCVGASAGGGMHGPLLRPDQMPPRQVLRGRQQPRRRRDRLRNLLHGWRLRPAGQVLRRRRHRYRPFRE